jgi:cyanophycinase-like exopeptidase
MLSLFKTLLKRHLAILFFFLFADQVFGQGYVSYFTGDTSDVNSNPVSGTVLMGGSTENDEAMKWWLSKANGGDVLVIRVSGSNGYNNYLYSELGLNVNSVETIVFQNQSASFDPYVKRRLSQCEALWIAGGDQSVYTNYWKNSPVDSLIQYLVNVKKIPIGGTSAGMAILGGLYFDAKNGSVTSIEALLNPYGPKVSIGRNDFLRIPFLSKTITDTHFDNPDRRGRLTTFLGRLYADSSKSFYAIASEEKTAVCIDEQGLARVFGNNPNSEFAYFVQVNCENDSLPEVCLPGQALSWNRSNSALKVCKISGNNTGSNYFDVSDWETHSGGTWENWFATNGVFGSFGSNEPVCITSREEIGEEIGLEAYPNPVLDIIRIQSQNVIMKARILDQMGRQLQVNRPESDQFEISAQHFPKGFYFLEITDYKGKSFNKKFQKL